MQNIIISHFSLKKTYNLKAYTPINFPFCQIINSNCNVLETLIQNFKDHSHKLVDVIFLNPSSERTLDDMLLSMSYPDIPTSLVDFIAKHHHELQGLIFEFDSDIPKSTRKLLNKLKFTEVTSLNYGQQPIHPKVNNKVCNLFHKIYDPPSSFNKEPEELDLHRSLSDTAVANYEHY